MMGVEVMKVGVGGAMSDFDIARRNEQMFYSSEKMQGMHAALAGTAILGIGIYMSKAWLIGIGVIVALIGVHRMGRAGQAHDAAQVEQLKAMAANTVA